MIAATIGLLALAGVLCALVAEYERREMRRIEAERRVKMLAAIAREERNR